MIAVLAGVFSALLIPQITREWQDRQREQELKQSLLEEISTPSTTAVRQAIALAGHHIVAAGGQENEAVPDVYQALRNSWLIRRASARSRVIVYFPELYACWYSYERAISDYLSLSVGGSESRLKSLERYVDKDFGRSYVDPATLDTCKPLTALPDVVQGRFRELKGKMHWDNLASPDHAGFQDAYAILGEELTIGMERIVETIVKTPAQGFSQGIF